MTDSNHLIKAPLLYFPQSPITNEISGDPRFILFEGGENPFSNSELWISGYQSEIYFKFLEFPECKALLCRLTRGMQLLINSSREDSECFQSNTGERKNLNNKKDHITFTCSILPVFNYIQYSGVNNTQSRVIYSTKPICVI